MVHSPLLKFQALLDEARKNNSNSSHIKKMCDGLQRDNVACAAMSSTLINMSRQWWRERVSQHSSGLTDTFADVYADQLYRLDGGIDD